MELFKIGNIDFTTFITMPSYKVNNEDVYEEWTDGNKKSHRDVSRTRVTGDFTMMFHENDDFFHFINTLKRYKDVRGGYIAPVSLYINNENRVVSDLEIFLDSDITDYLPVSNKSTNSGFNVRVTER